MIHDIGVHSVSLHMEGLGGWLYTSSSVQVNSSSHNWRVRLHVTYTYIHRDTVIGSVSYDFLSFFIVRDRRLYSSEWDVFRRSRDLLRLHNVPSLWEWVKTMTGGMSLWTCTRSPPTNTNNLALNWTHTVVTVMQQCLVCKFAKTVNSTWLYVHKDYTKILYHPHAIRCLQ